MGVFDTPLQPGTCEGSKNGSVFATVGGVWWGVFDTPLQPGTCDPSKYRCDSPTEYVWPFKKLSHFRPFRGRGVGRIRYAPRIGYVRSFEIPMQFSDRVRAALQKTVLFSSPSGPPAWRIQYAPTIGYVRSFEIPMRFPNRVRAILRNTDAISLSERRGCLGGGAVGATVCGGGGRE